MKVYNLGLPGAQSADVVATAKQWLPILQPEVVVYGICVNDFLPSGTGQYESNDHLQIPLPAVLKDPFVTKTRTGKLISTGYDHLLIGLHLRNDFYDDILKDFGSYQERFARDLGELNAVGRESTGHPVLAMVLDQYPEHPRGRRIAQIAEKLGHEAGLDVVPTDEYYRKYAGVVLHVSAWEGHPNATAHRIFAEMLAPEVGKYLTPADGDRHARDAPHRPDQEDPSRSWLTLSDALGPREERAEPVALRISNFELKNRRTPSPKRPGDG